MKRRKLQWYGLVSLSSGLTKTILQGTLKWGRRQGRQGKRWEDDIREWTGLEFAKSQRAVEDREKGRKLVVKLSLVPERPSRLRIDEMRDEFHQFSSVQSLDQLGRGRDKRADSAEFLFQSFLQEAYVSTSGVSRDVHSLMLSIQHFFCRP